MTLSRNPAHKQVAIVGLGRAAYSKELSARSPGTLGLTASIEAIRDAGLSAGEIDGVCGSNVTGLSPYWVQAALGIPRVTWHGRSDPPFGNSFVQTVNAVVSGACDTALLVHVVYRMPSRSRAAQRDPMRSRAEYGMADYRAFWGTGNTEETPIGAFGEAAYGMWASRYLRDFDVRREHFGMLAISDRTHAANNENAVLRSPLTMEEYLAARPVRAPLGLLDNEIPVDSGDAFILTTAERARDMTDHPVLVNAATVGIDGAAVFDEQTPDWTQMGQQVVMDTLWAKSGLTMSDMDLLYLYDGFTPMAMWWLEATGMCGIGEAGSVFEDSWDESKRQLVIGGRPLNTHGGSLSEGGTQGAGAIFEATSQLRQSAGARQTSTTARHALLTFGGPFFNSQGTILSVDS